MKNICVLLSFVLLLSAALANAQTTDTLKGTKLPARLSEPDAIAAALCIDVTTEREKANVIYNWITHNIEYDAKALWNLSDDSKNRVKNTIKSGKALCAGYSELFVALCKSAGLNAVTVDGYAKDMIFDNGDEMYIPRHEWVAVRVDGKWQLADPTWGAGYLYQSDSWLRKLLSKLLMQKKLKAKRLKFRYRYDPQYFLQDPLTFRLRHVPADPLWQLTDTAMPLAVFEAGDSSIRAFNTSYPQLTQKDSRLDKIAGMTDEKRKLEMASRVYAFNNRFHLALAIRNSVLADSLIEVINKDTTGNEAPKLLKVVGSEMKQSLEYVKLQKKGFPEEYSKLSRKNKTKAALAKQSIRAIKTDDKKLIAESNKHARSVEGKTSRAAKKAGTAKKAIQETSMRRYDAIKTAKIPKKPDAKELTDIQDSVTAKSLRVQARLKEIESTKAEIISLVSISKPLLDSLASRLGNEDSLLKNEAIERLQMHDSYDDEVKKWNKLFASSRFGTTDTLIKYYFNTFDTVCSRYEKVQKSYAEAINMSKANLRSLEQKKKWTATDPDATKEYAEALSDHHEVADSALVIAAKYTAYLKGNKSLFKLLGTLGKKQIKIAEYMEKAEKNRQEMESKTIARKKYTDMKENEMQRANIEKVLRKVNKATTGSKK